MVRTKDIHKEQAIIEKTLDIVSETGIAGIKMSVLAKRVGISPSTLYVYFKTKDDLINSIAAKLLKQISQNSATSLNKNGSFEFRLKSRWLGMLNFLMNNEREVNFIEQWKQSPYFNKNSQVVWEENKKVKADFFSKGKDKGIIKNISEPMIHAVMSGITKQMISEVKQGHIKLDKASTDLFFSLIWDALKK